MHRLTTLLILTILPLQSLSAVNFSDTELSYYRDSIQTLATEGIISGYGDGRFGPTHTITRAEILKILLGAK